jgi:PAS domain S-box-containing protein
MSSVPPQDLVLQSLRPVLDSALDAVVVIDGAGIVRAWNEGAVKSFGWSAGEALGQSMADLIVPPQHREAHWQGMKRYLATGEAQVLNQRIEISALRKDGAEFPVELSITATKPASGPELFIGFLRDISRRRSSEDALHEAREAAFAQATEKAAILGQLAEGVIVTDVEGRITFVNAAASRIHGVDKLDVAPEEYSATYHLFTEDGSPYPPSELPLARAVRGETVEEARWRIHRPDGSRVLAVGSARPLLDEQGQQVGAILTIKDDTARDAAEQLVRESEARLRALTDNLPGGMVYQVSSAADGSDRKFLYVSQSHEQLTGVPAEAVLADSSITHDLIHPDDREVMARAEAEARRSKTPFDVQVRFVRADGGERWCRIMSAAREQRDGSLIWDGLQIDITDRIKAELQLHELNRNLELRVQQRTAERDQLWNLSQDMLARADYEGGLSAVSPAWVRVLGRSEEELLTRPYSDIIHPDDLAGVLAALEEMRASGRPTRFENRTQAANGDWKPIGWTVAPEPDGIHFIAVGRDLSEEKQRERDLEAAMEQLRQSQKMEAVGQLTGGIAHDFNNLLTVVVGNMDMARRSLASNQVEKAERSIANALKGADRATILTQRLLAFSRRQPLAPKPTEVDRLLSGMSDLLARSLGETVQIETVTGAGLWRVEVDAPQLESAILNLAVNARDAMPEGGKLTIEAANTWIGSTYAATHAEVAPGQYVVICVTDTGTGMPRHVVESAFDPFFTTKEVGKGTGLGLSQVYGFVKQSGGHVKIYSEVGHGTTIKLYLPRMAGNPVEDGGSAPEPIGQGKRSETIMVVEDDDDVRTFTVESLRELGYRVLEAHDGPSALRLLERQSEPLQLLLTDVVMPEMSGRVLADKARDHQPDLKVLFTTGYARNAIVHGGRLDAGVELLPKPFSYEALAAKVRELLDVQPTDRLLIVAEELEDRLNASDLARQLGFAVESAANAREAMGKLRTNSGGYDAIFLSTAIPLLDSLVADIRTVRNDLPILLMADGASPEVGSKFSQDRCIGSLDFPFGAGDLQAALAALRVRCAGDDKPPPADSPGEEPRF